MGREVRRVPLDFNWESYKDGDPEPEEGDGYQFWETIGYTPISPVFATTDELKEFAKKNGLGGIFQRLSDEAVEALVEVGWCPTMVGVHGKHMNGADYLAEAKKAKKANLNPIIGDIRIMQK